MKKMPGRFGEAVRARRISVGLTQEELAARATVSIRTIRSIEQGQIGKPRKESTHKIFDALGLTSTVDHGQLHFSVLGPLTVHRGDEAIDIGPLKQRCLLGLLALRPNVAIGRDEIIDVLWGERPPSSYPNLVHTYVARLRKLVKPRRGPSPIASVTQGSYMLRAEDDQLDLLRFDRLTPQAYDADDEEDAYRLLSNALGCWRGPVLADLSERLHHHPAAVALGRRRLTAVLEFADRCLALGRYDEATDQIRSLIADEPYHEGLQARLMLALASAGQRAAALHVFTALRQQLAEELGLEPGEEVRAAHEQVLRGQTAPPDARQCGRPDRHNCLPTCPPS